MSNESHLHAGGSEASSILELPLDTTRIIFNMLDMSAILEAAQVCKLWSTEVWSAQLSFFEALPWWTTDRASDKGFLHFGSLKRCANLTTLNLTNAFTFCFYKYRNKRVRSLAMLPAHRLAPPEFEEDGRPTRESFDPSKRLDLEVFKSLTRLEYLNVATNPAMANDHLEAISCLTQLRELHLSQSGHFQSLSRMTLPRLSDTLLAMPNLSSLQLLGIDVDSSDGKRVQQQMEMHESSDDEENDYLLDPIVPPEIKINASFCQDVLVKLNKLVEISLPDWATDWECLSTLPNLRKLTFSANLLELMLPNFSYLKTQQFPRLLKFKSANILVFFPGRGATESLLAFCVSKFAENDVRWLLSHRDVEFCNPNAVDTFGATPLMYCTTVSMAKCLLEAGADIDAVSVGSNSRMGRGRRTTALLQAIMRGNHALAEFFLQRGASVAKGFVSPIFAAVRLNDEGHLLELLLKYHPNLLNEVQVRRARNGADMNVTPMMDAIIYSKSSALIKKVLSLATPEQMREFVHSRDISALATPLHNLIHRLGEVSNYHEIVDLLLSHGADIAAADADGRTPLWSAFYAGNEALLLRGKPLTRELNQRGCEKRSCLGLAVSAGRMQIVKESIANFDAADLIQDTIPVLYDMAKRCSVEDFLFLLTKQEVSLEGKHPADFVQYCQGLDVNLDSNNLAQIVRSYPILGALKNEDERSAQFITELLLLCGARPDVTDKFGVPSVMIASRNINLLSIFLKHGKPNTNVAFTPPDVKDTQLFEVSLGSSTLQQWRLDMLNHSALTFACKEMNYQVVEALLEAGADPNMKDPTDTTPLCAVLTSDVFHPSKPAGNGRKSSESAKTIVSALLKHGADPNVVDSHGYSPVTHVCRMDMQKVPCEEYILKALLDHGAIPPTFLKSANATSPGSVQQTVMETLAPSSLCFAMRHTMGREVYGKILDATPLLVHQPDPEGVTPLCRACQQLVFSNQMQGDEHLELVRFLIERGANIRQADRLGNTPLEYAITASRADFCKLLIEEDRKQQQASQNPEPLDIVNAVINDERQTPLVRAADVGSLEIVILLLNMGADVNLHCESAISLDGMTALHMAILSSQADIVKELLARNADVKALSRKRIPLQEALLKKSPKPAIVKMLVDAGSDLSVLYEEQRILMNSLLSKFADGGAPEQATSGTDNNASPFGTLSPPQTPKLSFALGSLQISPKTSGFSASQKQNRARSPAAASSISGVGAFSAPAASTDMDQAATTYPSPFFTASSPFAFNAATESTQVAPPAGVPFAFGASTALEASPSSTSNDAKKADTIVANPFSAFVAPSTQQQTSSPFTAFGTTPVSTSADPSSNNSPLTPFGAPFTFGGSQ